MENIREPKQERSILKKEKIIDAGWKLITTNGYYNTNTSEIAKNANVSIGIVYQYFKDKHDILIAGLYKYGDDIFYPMFKLGNIKISKDNFSSVINKMIDDYVKDHKIAKDIHEEIIAMSHLDHEVADYFNNREMNLTNELYELLKDAEFEEVDLLEKIHIMIGMIDNFCHEVVYHNHNELDYEKMKNLIIKNIYNFIAK